VIKFRNYIIHKICEEDASGINDYTPPKESPLDMELFELIK